jgi:hypothetical protein
MRCPRCGNENPDPNRFCGMCGATLLAAPQAPTMSTQRAATAASATPAKEAPTPPIQVSDPLRPAAPVSGDTPSISGPSFLGLSDPAPRQRASLSIDPDSGASRNLDYLLEDEDQQPHKSSGAGKFFLFLVALALAAGFGYLRWRNHGQGFLGSTTKPSSAATQPASDGNSSPAPDSQVPAVQPTATPTQPPVSTSTAAPATTAAPAPSAPSSGSATPDTAPPSAPSPGASKPADAASPAANSDTPAPTSGKDSTASAKQPAASDAPSAPDSNEPKPALAPKPPAAKPSVDPVAEAQKYLYGRGVSQDCDRGMRYLKPAANQGNPKAMVEMGALYSAGLCTPHDLPTAYRWFAMALRKDPDNQDVQSDLQKLWGEMTQPERQLAIKLTQ